jgi:hypothetical protein
MDSQAERRANLRVVAGLAIWAVSFTVSLCVLAVAAYYAGLIEPVLINPTSEPFPWVMPTIIGISFVLAVVVVRLTLRK